MLTITHVAIWYEGKLYSLPKPNRHHNVIHLIYSLNGNRSVGFTEQGFLDSDGKYLSREEAVAVALASGQIKDTSQIRGGQLYSEDVW